MSEAPVSLWALQSQAAVRQSQPTLGQLPTESTVSAASIVKCHLLLFHRTCGDRDLISNTYRALIDAVISSFILLVFGFYIVYGGVA